MTNHRRRNYFIDKNFQAKFILKFCLIVIVSSLLIGGILFFLSRNSTTVAIENTKVTVKRTSDFILPIMIQTILVVSIFSALVVVLLTMFISHKIAGPLYRLKREIEALGEGNLGVNFDIRKDDQLQDLSKSLNQMVFFLRTKYLELKEKLKEINKFLEDNKSSLFDKEKEEIAKKLKGLENTLNFFKT